MAISQGLRGLVKGPSIAVILVGGALASNCLADPDARAATPGDLFGVNAQELFGEPQSTWDPQLAAIAAGGLGLVRTSARWSTVESTAPSGGGHSYDWSSYDAIVGELSAHGLRWYPALEYAPGWAAQASGDQSPAPARDADFAAYAAALAARYGPAGSFWSSHPSLAPEPVVDYEIWNEENSAVFWPSQADAPERYADLYAAARLAIRARVPQARVVVGGLALFNPPVVQDEVGFLELMLAHRPDLRGAVDAVGLHPYQATLQDTNTRLSLVRQAVNGLLGPAVPIDITEVGWTSTSTPEEQRATYLSGLASELPGSQCNVARVLAYAWTTRESDPLNPEDWFGIWNHDASAKPSGQAYTGMVRRLATQPLSESPSDPCTQRPAAPPVAAALPVPGPRLRLRLSADRGHRRLTVFARCPSSCAMTVALSRRRAAKLIPVARRSTAFSKRRRQFRLRYPRRARVMRLDVVATGTGGGHTTRVRTLRAG